MWEVQDGFRVAAKVLRCSILAAITMLGLPRSTFSHAYQNAKYLDTFFHDPCREECDFFGMHEYYFCFQTNDRILIGEIRRFHPWRWRYDPRKMNPLEGSSVS